MSWPSAMYPETELLNEPCEQVWYEDNRNIVPTSADLPAFADHDIPYYYMLPFAVARNPLLAP